MCVCVYISLNYTRFKLQLTHFLSHGFGVQVTPDVAINNVTPPNNLL